MSCFFEDLKRFSKFISCLRFLSSILVFDSSVFDSGRRSISARSGCISPPSSMDRVFYPDPLDRSACVSLFLDYDTEGRQDDGSEWVSYKKATCPICLDVIEDTDGIVLNCKKHSFHCKCAARALQEQTTCPVCRQNLSTSSTSVEQSASEFRFADRLERNFCSPCPRQRSPAVPEEAQSHPHRLHHRRRVPAQLG